MSLTSLLTQTVSIKNYEAGAADEYGNISEAFGDPAIYQGRLEQLDNSREVTVGRDTVTADFRLFLPPEATIGPFDEVVADGRTFQVVGLPMLEKAPLGPPSHVLAHLRFIE